MSDLNESLFARLPDNEQAHLLAKHATRGGNALTVMSGADLLARDFPPLTFLVDNLIARGYLVVLGGRGKSGKTWLGLQLARAIDQGGQFLDRHTTRGKVLYIALEDGERRIRQRVMTLAWKPAAFDVATGIAKFSGANGETGQGLDQLREAIAVGGYDLVIIDTLIATLAGTANENDNAAMGAILNELAAIAHVTETAIVLVHHTGKQFSDDPFSLLRGASAIRGAYDLGLILVRKPGEREALLHVEARDFDGQSMTLQQAANGAGWEVIGDGNALADIGHGRAAVELLHDYGEGLTAGELAEASGKSERNVYKILATAEKRFLVKQDKARPAKWYLMQTLPGDELD